MRMAICSQRSCSGPVWSEVHPSLVEQSAGAQCRRLLHLHSKSNLFVGNGFPSRTVDFYYRAMTVYCPACRRWGACALTVTRRTRLCGDGDQNCSAAGHDRRHDDGAGDGDEPRHGGRQCRYADGVAEPSPAPTCRRARPAMRPARSVCWRRGPPPSFRFHSNGADSAAAGGESATAGGLPGIRQLDQSLNRPSSRWPTTR